MWTHVYSWKQWADNNVIGFMFSGELPHRAIEQMSSEPLQSNHELIPQESRVLFSYPLGPFEGLCPTRVY